MILLKQESNILCSNVKGMQIVIYWPSTEPSIKRCTCVNKRKNSETGASGRRYRNITLTCGRGWIRWWWQMRTPTGSGWKSNKAITRCHRWLGAVAVPVGDGCQRSEIQLQAWALSDPRLSSLARMRKKCCYGQKTMGSICSSLSPSPTHLSHTTNINPFESKVWEVYFYKEVLVWFVGFYGISTFVGYLTPNPFSCK